MYCGLDSAFNPAHEGRRVEELKSNLYSTYIGTNTAWYEPYVAPALAKVAGPAIASTWIGSSLLPATLAYSTVKGTATTNELLCCCLLSLLLILIAPFRCKFKGVGWYDWGNSGLNDHEMRLNGLDAKEV